MRYASRAIIIKDEKILLIRRNKFGHKYFILPGGGVKSGESSEQALYREVQEETGIKIKNQRLVFIEDAGQPYGIQLVFLGDYVSGEPHLSPASEEAKIAALGLNLYEPMWVTVEEMTNSSFISKRLQAAILEALKTGFPNEPKPLQ